MYRLSQTADHDTFVKASDAVNHISDFIKVGNSLISSHLALTSRGYEVPYMKKPLFCPYEEYKDKIREDAEEISKAIELIKELDPEYKYVEL